MAAFDGLLDSPTTSIAVVGATDNPFKFGGKIYRDLKRKGFQVFAVNLTRDTVDGDPAYATLADLPEAPDIIDVVVPSDVGIDIARQANELGYKRIWYQPGSESTAIVDYLDTHGFEYLAGPCIMVHTRTVSAP
ncbi:MAG: CoA-binding protein [Acidimicrobiia bacterium]|nr:CoA-binding protein [Acidimicrobiia bacterium]